MAIPVRFRCICTDPRDPTANISCQARRCHQQLVITQGLQGCCAGLVSLTRWCGLSPGAGEHLQGSIRTAAAGDPAPGKRQWWGNRFPLY